LGAASQSTYENLELVRVRLEGHIEVLADHHRFGVAHRGIMTPHDLDTRDTITELQLLTDGFVELPELPPRLRDVLDFDLKDGDSSIRIEEESIRPNSSPPGRVMEV